MAKQLGVAWRGSQVSTAGARSFALGPADLVRRHHRRGGPVRHRPGPERRGRKSFQQHGAGCPQPAAGGCRGQHDGFASSIRGGQAIIEAAAPGPGIKDQARILSAPKLVTLDNITARTTRSQNIFVQVNTVSPAGGYGGVGLQEIQTGLTLEITPSIVPAQSERDQSLVRLNLRAGRIPPPEPERSARST